MGKRGRKQKSAHAGWPFGGNGSNKAHDKRRNNQHQSPTKSTTSSINSDTQEQESLAVVDNKPTPSINRKTVTPPASKLMKVARVIDFGNTFVYIINTPEECDEGITVCHFFGIFMFSHRC
jgi:hypothetical protein